MSVVNRKVFPLAALVLLCGSMVTAGGAAAAPSYGTARAISVGGSSACAITPTKHLECWGLNNDGQLGIGEDLTDQLTPVRVPGLRNVEKVSVGDYSTCAVLRGGRLKCWGYNGDGELGDGTTTDRHVPTQVKGLTSGVTDVSVGNAHACALLANGHMKCWGDNRSGAVGSGTSRLEYHHAVRVVGVSDARQMSAGVDVTCAVVSNGRLKCWGNNSHGEIGDRSTKDRRRPAQVAGLSSGVHQVVAGYYSTCAVLAAGRLKCWGDNTSGQIGTGVSGGYFTHPVQVLRMTRKVTSVDTNDGFTCAVKEGAAKCWGKNDSYQLGDGTVDPYYVPHQVSGLTTSVSDVGLGFASACALRRNGVVKCWGSNTKGEAGVASADPAVPTPKTVHL